MLCCIAVLTGMAALARWMPRWWRSEGGSPGHAARACVHHCIAERVRPLLVFGVVLMLGGQTAGALLQAHAASPAWADFICTTAANPIQGEPKPLWLD